MLLYFFRNLVQRIPFDDESSFVGPPLNKDVITDWYKSKIETVVEITGLIECGIELLDLASKNNITVSGKFSI